MEKDYLKLSLDDIVFEHRNRAYGAYALRQQYGGRIERASVAGFAVFLLLIFSPKILEKLSAKTVNLFGESVTLAAPPPIKNEPPPPKLPPPPALPPPKQVATTRFLPPQVTVETETEPPIPDVPKDANIGTKTIESKETGYVAPSEAVAPPPVEVRETKAEEPKVVQIFNVEQVPQFPDGNAAMYKFLASQIKYPSVARENGIEGTVYVSFVVWLDGSIRNIEIKRGIGGGCNDEALRVVNLMPKWSPGKQNGKAVPVAFTLPIKFKLD